MCGIAGIISKKNNSDLAAVILQMSAALSHRGPDGEGFISYDGRFVQPHHGSMPVSQDVTLDYLNTTPLSRSDKSHLYFAHRRLAIIDTGSSGHQPMSYNDGKLWITYNGEIYNYKELRDELRASGHNFRTSSDTEIILASYVQWGTDCVSHFDGMWAFCLLDISKQQCFISRDRLGVKPFYFLNNADHFAFASEQKAFVAAGLVVARPSAAGEYDYLVNGLLERSTENFFRGITELMPGSNLILDLRNMSLEARVYYDVRSQLTSENDEMSEDQLVQKTRVLLERSVSLRMRSDIEVGTCLSGGLDSSIIAALMSREMRKPFHCFTSVFRDSELSEERYADLVASFTGAIHHKSAPQVDELWRDFDALIYSQDTPIWDTSTYAQHRVMALAASTGIHVVLDGQGADELFAGYHHHFLASWNQQISSGHFLDAAQSMHRSRFSLEHPLSFFIKETAKKLIHVPQRRASLLLKNDFIAQRLTESPRHLRDVNAQLIDDITNTRLKIFLKCEDRCGMWHSVESRTPFSDDVNLINFAFSFNGTRKIRNGQLKYILRKAAKDLLPEQITGRRDKKGFETPMFSWVKKLETQMLGEVREQRFEFVDADKLEKFHVANMNDARLLFKLFVLTRWRKVFAKDQNAAAQFRRH